MVGVQYWDKWLRKRGLNRLLVLFHHQAPLPVCVRNLASTPTAQRMNDFVFIICNKLFLSKLVESTNEIRWNKVVAPVELWGLFCKISAKVISFVFLCYYCCPYCYCFCCRFDAQELRLFWISLVFSYFCKMTSSAWSSETKNQTKTKNTWNIFHGGSWNISSFLYKMGNTEIIMFWRLVIPDLLWVIRIKARVVLSEVTCTADDLVQLFLLHCHLFTGPKLLCN